MLKNNSLDPTDYSYEKDDYFIPIQLNNWTLSDMQSCVCTFPSFSTEPVKVCRIYIKENHPEWCGINYGSGSAIWNNTGDTATLMDDQGQIINEYSY